MGNFYTDVIQKDPRFSSPRPCNDLNLLEPVTRAAVKAIVVEAAERGITLVPTETYRSAALQAVYYTQKRTKLPHVGLHHYGLACDLLIRRQNGEFVKDAREYFILKDLAEKHGLISGQDWGEPNKKHSFVDADHVQRITVGDQAKLFSGSWYPDNNYNPLAQLGRQPSSSSMSSTSSNQSTRLHLPAVYDLFVQKVGTLGYGRRLMKDMNLTDFQSAGVFGNIGHECGGFRTLQEQKPNSGKGGYGWAQWTGPLRTAYLKWCSAKGFDPASDSGNYSYLVEWMSRVWGKYMPALRRTKDVDEATKFVMEKLERPGTPRLASRQAWGHVALEIIRNTSPKAQATTETADQTTGIQEFPTDPTTSGIHLPQDVSGWFNLINQILSWIKPLIGKSHLPNITLPPAADQDSDSVDGPMKGDPVVAHVQKVLSDHGYTEVGMIDGLPGPKLANGIRAAQHDNGLVETGEIDDELLALLPVLPVRIQSSERMTATVNDLRQAGNPMVNHADTIKRGGWLISALGGLGAAGGSGILDTLQSTLQSVQGTADSATTVVSGLSGVAQAVTAGVQWVAVHWWIIAFIGGFFIIFKAVSITEDVAIKFRQAFLTRKD